MTVTLRAALADGEPRLRGMLPVLLAECEPEALPDLAGEARRLGAEARLGEALAALAFLMEQVPADPEFRTNETLTWVTEAASRWGGAEGVRTLAAREGLALPPLVAYPRDYLKTLFHRCHRRSMPLSGVRRP